MINVSRQDEFICFIDHPSHDQFKLREPNLRVVDVQQSATPTQAAAADAYRSPLDMLRLSRAVTAEPLDVFFFPSVYTYFPLPPRLPAVVTIHDAIAERFPDLTLPSWRARLFWRSKVRLAIWQARLVLTVSDFSARDLTSILGIPPHRIRVTSEAPSAAFRPSDSQEQIRSAAARLGLPDGARWIVYVGGFNPHKHVDLIVRAHAAVVEKNTINAPLYLLLVGTANRDVFHADLENLNATVAIAGTGSLVKWTGFLPDEELRHIHSGAVALILPSACEGFGLPAVEAAACGTPVVATTESPLPELLAGGGLFVPPGAEAALIDALHTLLGDENKRLQMGVNARDQAAKLSWTHSARVAMQALREAAR
jgi:alpha-1,3-rhamnosyl/mannosyltransferase